MFFIRSCAGVHFLFFDESTPNKKKKTELRNPPMVDVSRGRKRRKKDDFRTSQNFSMKMGRRPTLSGKDITFVFGSKYSSGVSISRIPTLNIEAWHALPLLCSVRVSYGAMLPFGFPVRL